MEQDRRQDDMATIAWPGFVDILSAVIIMFIFFVMVMVIVLYIYTIKFTATVEEKAERRIEESVKNIERPAILGDLEEEKDKKLEEIKELEYEKQQTQQEVANLKEELKQLSVGLSDSFQQQILISENEIIVLFANNSVTLEEESEEKIKEFLNVDPENSIIVIEAGEDPFAPTQSSSRQLSLARMLNVRNIALASGYEPNMVSINYVEAEEIKGRYDWTKLMRR